MKSLKWFKDQFTMAGFLLGLILSISVFAFVLTGCSQKPCPKPFDSFTIYDRPAPLLVEGSYTLVDLEEALRKVSIKSRIQSAIIDNYENDVRRYNKVWKDLK